MLLSKPEARASEPLLFCGLSPLLFRAPRNDELSILARLPRLWHREAKRPRGHGAVLRLCSHHTSSPGDFFMRRFLVLAGTAITLLVASAAAAGAQQPIQRV